MRSPVPYEDLTRGGDDAPLVGVGEATGDVVETHPFDLLGLVIRIVLRGEVAADRLEEEMVDDLVNTMVVTGEPVVNGSQMAQYAPRDAGLLGDLAHSRLLGRLGALQVALGKAPFEAASAVAARNDGGHRAALLDVDHEPAGAGLVDHRQEARTRASRRCAGAGLASAVGGHEDTLGGSAEWVPSGGPRGRLGSMTDPADPALPSVSSASSASPSASGSSRAVGGSTAVSRSAVRALLDESLDTCGLSPTAREALRALPPSLAALGHAFTRAGYELALVGGPVRDAFLGVVPHDLDCATSARPEQTERILSAWGDACWDIGKEFGTIGARKGETVVEATTYRTEEYEVGSRKPVVAYGDTLEGDLTRRDFTINAMALRLPDLELVDPCGGLDDLRAGVLRTPVSAVQSFDDDPLRIMRAARFSAQLGFDVEMDVMTAMEEMAPRLKIVSAERVRAELERLLISPWPRRGLELMVHTGVADIVLPELAALVETVDEHKRHKDVYEHTLTVLDQAMDLETGPDGPVPAPDLVLRLAAVMHDVGKPATRRFLPGGTVTFHGHDHVGARMTRKRLRALRFDKQTIKDVSRLVELHLRFHGYADAAWSDSAVRRYVADAGPLLERLHRLTRADVTTRNKRKARMLDAAYDDLEDRIAALREAEELAAIRPDLDGAQIMDELGVEPGPVVGEAYRFLLDLRMEKGPLGEEMARQALRSWWAAR